MATMYEMIMDFPLFKGISRDHVSMLLERNHVVFESYEPCDTIYKVGETCRQIAFLVQGNVEVSRVSSDAETKISYTLSPGAVIGADSLFGWDTSFASEVKALTKTSILTFTKEEYLRVLSSDDIYLINALNYLSRGLQWARMAAIDFNGNSISDMLCRLVLSLTDRQSRDIKVIFKRELSVDDKEICAGLSREGLISLSDGTVSIPDVRALCEYISGSK